MNKLPSAALQAKDAGHTHGYRGEFLGTADLGVQTVRLAIDVRRRTRMALGIVVSDVVGGEVVIGPAGLAWPLRSLIDCKMTFVGTQI